MRVRGVCLLLALLCLAFAAYGSLVPLRLRYVPFDEALARFRAVQFIPIASASKTDLVANVVLFLPAGFFLGGALLPRRRTIAVFLVPVAVAVLLAASVVIEFSQVYSRVRTPSLNDVAAETFGGLIGVLAWLAVGPAAAEWVRRAAFLPTASDRFTALLWMYAAGWVVMGLLPLDFTLRPAELAEKYRAGLVIVVPFAKERPVLDAVRDLGGAALSAVPIGMLAALVLQRARTPAMAASIAGCAAVAALELAQLFVMSRTADTTDVLAGVAGVGVGVVVLTARAGAGLVEARSSIAILAGLAVWLGVLALRHWAPFDFTTDYALVRQKLPDLFQVPFRNYYAARPLDALWEAGTKILLGIPVGALLQLLLILQGVRLARGVQLVLIAFTSFFLFAAVEIGQVFLPTRYPDGTDIVLGTVGALVGGVGMRMLRVRPDARDV